MKPVKSGCKQAFASKSYLILIVSFDPCSDNSDAFHARNALISMDTVISGRLPAGNVLIFLQTVAGAGYRKVQLMSEFFIHITLKP